jgi:hypothetical protein
MQVITLIALLASVFLPVMMVGCVAEPTIEASGHAVGGSPKLRAMINYVARLHEHNSAQAGRKIVAAYYSATICPLPEPFSMAYDGSLPASEHSVPANYVIFVPASIDDSSTASLVQVLVSEGSLNSPECVTTRLFWNWEKEEWLAKGTLQRRLSAAPTTVQSPKPASDNNISAVKSKAGAPTSLPGAKPVFSSRNWNEYALLEEYVRFLDVKERVAFFASLEENGFRATLTHLPVPASGAYSFSSGGAVYTSWVGRLTEEEWDRYSSEVVLVTYAIREIASKKATPEISTPAQKLGAGRQ